MCVCVCVCVCEVTVYDYMCIEIQEESGGARAAIIPLKAEDLDIWVIQIMTGDFPGGPVVKNLPAKAGDAGDVGSVPGSGRSPGGGNGNPLQYSCLEYSIDRGAWWVAVHVAAKSQT